MKLTSNTVLVTGGASGIGLAIAEKFLTQGNTVIICGRQESKLQEAKLKYPGLQTRVCDIAKPAAREKFCAHIAEEFPALNVLVNNAGIQLRISLATLPRWESMQEEIAINLEAPIHLSTLLLPQLLKQKDAAIVNVTSGLAFTPLANVPVYSATKAALRSFTLSLRNQLKNTSVSVVEIIPPAVNTDLGGVGLHTFGAPIPDFIDAIWEQLRNGKHETAYGLGVEVSQASREQLDQIFTRMNQPR